MALRFASELFGRVDTVPQTLVDGFQQGGSLICFHSKIVLAASGNGLVTTADQVLLSRVPAGLIFAFGILTASVSMGGTAAIAIGTGATHATNGQYRAAATFTAVNTPTLFGTAAAMDDDTVLNAVTPTYLTVGAADLPTSGTLLVDLFYRAAR